MRRGDQSSTKTLAEVLEGQTWDLNPGDTISVELPKFLSVTIGGSVQKPGEIKIRQGTTIVPAIQAAGGPLDTGTLQNLILFRGDETRVFDGRSLAQGGTDPGFALQAGDFVYVPENLREYHVLGFVMRPGRKLMPDTKPVRLVDAIAASEGINNAKGTYRHMIVMRPDTTGKYIVHKYDLDRYLKDGDASQNPEIQPGDIVFVDQTSGTALIDILRLIPNLILLDRFF
jgi:protein involved in polysaccharide export with SLBB domain